MTTLANANSNAHFYRFRSIDNLLGKRKELEEQKIYFASQDQLNDPLEGHINIYWQGDAIIWRNLFKNYLYSTLFTYNFWSLCKTENTLGWEDIPVRNPLAAGIFSEHYELESIFFNDPHVSALIDRIINSKRRIGRNELTAHLRTVHYFVVCKIHEIYRARHEKANPDEIPVVSLNLAGEIKKIRIAIDLFDHVDKMSDEDTEIIETQYINIVNQYEESDLLNYYTDALNLSDRNRIFIFNDFCQAYVRRLATLMYPPWYAACFMEDCSAASMWAYYGESHTGICLKFKTESSANGPLLNLNTITGYNMGGEVKSMRPHYFEPVLYRGEHTTLNFFETLGAAPTPILNAQWYTNDKREISALLLRSEAEREAWKKVYWERYKIINKTKTETWKAEQEHRLVYYSMLGDLSVEDRTLTYDFSSLDAIIFGVRTPTAEKINIIKVIEKKCRENGRVDFKFYQANFSNNQNEMEFAEIRTLSNVLASS